MKFNKNKLYKIPSGLGGIYKVKFLSEADNKFIFRVMIRGFERNIKIDKKVAKKVKEYEYNY